MADLVRERVEAVMLDPETSVTEFEVVADVNLAHFPLGYVVIAGWPKGLARKSRPMVWFEPASRVRDGNASTKTYRNYENWYRSWALHY